MKLYETYFMLREYEESSYFALCSQIECPIRRTKCLRVARILCRNNKVCQQAIDRELDAIAMKHGFPNEDPGNFYPGGLSEGEVGLSEAKSQKFNISRFQSNLRNEVKNFYQTAGDMENRIDHTIADAIEYIGDEVYEVYINKQEKYDEMEIEDALYNSDPKSRAIAKELYKNYKKEIDIIIKKHVQKLKVQLPKARALMRQYIKFVEDFKKRMDRESKEYEEATKKRWWELIGVKGLTKQAIEKADDYKKALKVPDNKIIPFLLYLNLWIGNRPMFSPLTDLFIDDHTHRHAIHNY